ncbi:MAG: hypothetical protein MPK75_01490 [Alphaproteobacteria bacterium]|nr:hypothetical protein [Alphaproteobacteria bacterium]
MPSDSPELYPAKKRFFNMSGKANMEMIKCKLCGASKPIMVGPGGDVPHGQFWGTSRVL